jgi:DNA-binding MarR family transcriptional regulator
MQNTTFQLIEVMFKISRLMKEKMSFSNSLMHLSAVQIQTLMFLNLNKVATMSTIADYFRMELPSATSLVNKLCEQELVIRHEDPGDRRLVKIKLSSDGKKLLEQVKRHHRNKMEKLLSYLSEKEKSGLLDILKTLNNRLQK